MRETYRADVPGFSVPSPADLPESGGRQAKRRAGADSSRPPRSWIAADASTVRSRRSNGVVLPGNAVKDS